MLRPVEQWKRKQSGLLERIMIGKNYYECMKKMKENGNNKIINKINYDACDKYLQNYTA